jgi:hypothetical protein
MTITPWNNLYCLSDDAGVLVRALQDTLTQLGYERYNPFGLIPAKVYTESVRLFVAPSVSGWTRIIGTFDERQFAPLSQAVLCLYLSLDVHAADIRVYAGGELVDAAAALTPYLRPGRGADELAQILRASPAHDFSIPDDAEKLSLPFEALPDDVQAMADKVDPKQAQKMFDRLSGHMMNRMGGDQADAARALITGEGKLDWDSAAGRQIRALMNCLTVPEGWREPDFIALRDSYPLHERKRRNPNARQYPGDEAIMAQVPNALDYTPVYGGIH